MDPSDFGHSGLWAADSNKAISISLIQPDGSVVGKPFHPKFTYPIFGDSETIYGFKDLKIELRFSASDLLPYLQVSYSAQLEDKDALATVIAEEESKQNTNDENWEDEDEVEDEVEGEGAAKSSGSENHELEEKSNNNRDVDKQHINGDNPSIVLKKFLSPDTLTMEKEFLKAIHAVGTRFSPPGTFQSSYSLPESSDTIFEIWKCPLSDTNQLALHLRMQIFALFFIEAGSFIDLADDRWRIYTLYAHNTQSDAYSFVGFCTVYSYLWYKTSELHISREPEATRPSDFFNLYHRKRISQFVILPPYSGHQHGTHFYNALMDEFYADPAVKEVTVEDPNVAFDDMRDRADLARLDKLGIFNDPIISNALNNTGDPVVDKQWLEWAQSKTKIIPRQFQRLVELVLLRGLSKSNKKSYKRYRLLVKQRLYKHNKDALKDLDRFERIQKLDETYRSVEQDYYRLLSKVPTLESPVEPDESYATYLDRQQSSGSPQIQGKGKKRELDISDTDTKRFRTGST
ncbi:acyl-CoA N-acyltransferase [Lipomyces oligophaga]|uniref:acyl-CoA N-acyltransferase n=1 Tax=Lipomyces oligophaga TaxID=45792 RepID=UPI0034CF18FA